MNTDTATTVTGFGAGGAMIVDALSAPDPTSLTFWCKLVGGLAVALLGYLSNK